MTYNKCHKFWRGKVVSAHKSFVDEQVDAAKSRLGLMKYNNQFNISAMVKKIEELAPGARYRSANPLPTSTSTTRPRVKPRRSPPRRTTSLARRAPPDPRLKMPPVLPPVLSSVLARESSPMAPRTSTWYRGDPCIVSHGEAIGEDLCYDHPTQLQHCDDGHEDQVEVDSKASVDSLICEDCAVEHEVECYDTEEEDYSVAKEPRRSSIRQSSSSQS